MKLLTIVLLLCSLATFAQTPTHSATLTWSDTPAQIQAGATYNIYRSTGMCSGTPTFSKLASGVTVLTYVDTTVQPGDYCYEVTATLNGMESAPSNTALAAVPSFPPATLAVSVK